ncbi:MAG: hypothetical protein U5L45_15910 [Saprospiraceae bacterium]|nr:hypothetical protein [Saprospiraceae bacterium]
MLCINSVSAQTFPETEPTTAQMNTLIDSAITNKTRKATIFPVTHGGILKQMWRWVSTRSNRLHDSIQTVKATADYAVTGLNSKVSTSTFGDSLTAHRNNLDYVDSAKWSKNGSTIANASTLIGHNPPTLIPSMIRNTIIGSEAGYSLGKGVQPNYGSTRNTIIGFRAAKMDSAGFNNTFVGVESAYFNKGFHNVAVGWNAYAAGAGGNYNTVVGSNSYYFRVGSNNTFLGSGNGVVVDTLTNGTFIGSQSQPSVSNLTSLTNVTAIGYNSRVEVSNSLILGNGVNVGIGTSAPSHKLHVIGRINAENLRLDITTLPVFADNAAAASLQAGDVYRTATGDLKIKY